MSWSWFGLDRAGLLETQAALPLPLVLCPAALVVFLPGPAGPLVAGRLALGALEAAAAVLSPAAALAVSTSLSSAHPVGCS